MGVKLLFGLETSKENLKLGLYINQPRRVVEMREAEALSKKSDSVVIDDDVLEAFRNKVSRRMGKILPKYIFEVFKNYISPPVEVTTFDRELIVAINN